MKHKYTQLSVAVGAAIMLLLVIWKMIETVDTGGASPKSTKSQDLKQVKSEDSLNDDAMNPQTGPMRQAQNPKKHQFYEIVGPFSMPLEMSEQEVRKRANAGLKCLQRRTLPTEDKPMPNMREAYKRLIHDEVFMEGGFPIWGIECELYFVFSGYRDCDPHAAFNYGFAVRKDDGRIFRWWLQNNERAEQGAD